MTKEELGKFIAEITENGEALREKAASVPEKVSGCVKLNFEEAQELYRLLYKALGAFED